MPKQPLGKLPATAFGMLEIPRLAPDIIAGFKALGDLTAKQRKPEFYQRNRQCHQQKVGL